MTGKLKAPFFRDGGKGLFLGEESVGEWVRSYINSVEAIAITGHFNVLVFNDSK
jgi:hypothetical protein